MISTLPTLSGPTYILGSVPLLPGNNLDDAQTLPCAMKASVLTCVQGELAVTASVLTCVQGELAVTASVLTCVQGELAVTASVLTCMQVKRL